MTTGYVDEDDRLLRAVLDVLGVLDPPAESRMWRWAEELFDGAA
ncbi:hypothetical protein [Actinocorallia herbida]|nr:hypothetical protein [Actinocorallia herbida]